MNFKNLNIGDNISIKTLDKILNNDFYLVFFENLIEDHGDYFVLDAGLDIDDEYINIRASLNKDKRFNNIEELENYLSNKKNYSSTFVKILEIEKLY